MSHNTITTKHITDYNDEVTYTSTSCNTSDAVFIETESEMGYPKQTITLPHQVFEEIRDQLIHYGHIDPYSDVEYRTVADIRNKITPIVSLIEVIEMEEDKETIDTFIKTAKKYVNILCDREVFEEKE